MLVKRQRLFTHLWRTVASSYAPRTRLSARISDRGPRAAAAAARGRGSTNWMPTRHLQAIKHEYIRVRDTADRSLHERGGLLELSVVRREAHKRYAVESGI